MRETPPLKEAEKMTEALVVAAEKRRDAIDDGSEDDIDESNAALDAAKAAITTALIASSAVLELVALYQVVVELRERERRVSGPKKPIAHFLADRDAIVVRLDAALAAVASKLNEATK
jgi:hypothetical protein